MFQVSPAISRLRSCLTGYIILAAFVFWPGQPAFAQGLVVAPTRVVMEGRTRSVTISLLNNGAEAAIYRITIINMRMTETGQFEQLEKDTPAVGGEKFAGRLFRYAPARSNWPAGSPRSSAFCCANRRIWQTGNTGRTCWSR